MTALAKPSSSGSAAPGPYLPRAARIQRIREEIPHVRTYELSLEDHHRAANVRFAPGQFNMLYLPGFGEVAISISSDPGSTRTIAHTVRNVGNVTSALARLAVGDEIGVRGPFGSAWPLDRCRGCDVVVCCGGLGLAPLRPAVYHLLNHRADYGRIVLLYGSRSPADLLYASEYDDWRARGMEVETTVDLADARWSGQIGVAPMLFYHLRLSAEKTRVLLCGPEIMMRFAAYEALARKIEPAHIYLSLERNMQCAVALCGHCQLGGNFVCQDGPVFTYERMAALLQVEDL